MPEEPVTLLTLGGGALVELFDKELGNVIRNIADPNTDPTTRREILLRVSIKPKGEERTMGEVTIRAQTKLASLKPAATVIFMGRRGNQVVAVESNPQQLSFGVPDNLRPIEGGKKE